MLKLYSDAQIKCIFFIMKDIIHCGVFMIDKFLYLLFHNSHLLKFGTIP